MNCLCEALNGAAGSARFAAVSPRHPYARRREQGMDLFKEDNRPSDIMTAAAISNALTVDMALGCSSNSVLHLFAITHELGLRLNLDIVNRISENTPNICKLAPAGEHHVQDLHFAGGVYAVMNELNKSGRLDLTAITVTGKTVGENIKTAEVKNRQVIRSCDDPYSATGGLAVLFGNLAVTEQS
jgi:dihydroxy-acid dehydratase